MERMISKKIKSDLIPPELKKILDQIKKKIPLKKISDDHIVDIQSLPKSAISLLGSAIYNYLKTFKIIVISKNNSICEQLIQECLAFIPQEHIIYFPDWNTLPYAGQAPDRELIRERINALYRIWSESPAVVFTTCEAMARKIVPPEHLLSKGLKVELGQDYPFDEIIRTLVKIGYRREDMVESFGQFAQRGDIIDIFPPSSENPLRLHFFGDQLERISEFDPISQISSRELKRINILPKAEILPSVEDKIKIKEWVEEYSKKLKNKKSKTASAEDFWQIFQQKISIDEDYGYEDLIPAFLNPVSLPASITSDKIYLFADMDSLKERWEQIYREYDALYEENQDDYPCFSPSELLVPYENLFNDIMPSFQLSLLAKGSPQNINIDLGIKMPLNFRGKIQHLRDRLKEYIDNNFKIYLSSPFEAQLFRMKDLLRQFNPQMIHKNGKSKVFLVQSDLKEGFEIPRLKFIILTDFEIFGRSYRKKTHFKRKKSKAITSFLDIKPGDYVVHINHGIGQFTELKRVKAGGKERDFLILSYHNNDLLYIPLDQISMIQRYIGSGDSPPKLDMLGKNSWQKVKERVKINVEELARELIQIYAARKKMNGYTFPADTIWQEEFEAIFPYEETPDQIQAIEDVKKDMESNLPMDRLICGDVGFGKTEVAIRASFKAAMAGKQTALLVPTTILCMQHYKTLTERFAEYPINVAMLSRFVSPQGAREAKQKLARGEIDILVGTHALLGKEIIFKNLGMVIIDEEQRFGVKHKEKLKKYRTLVDVLTLTATPIPRTLHMSLAKMRDISVINTPPLGRKAIETYIMEDNPEILKMAIQRELERGGQIFYIHNRVATIERASDFLMGLVPNGTIRTAHGQLPKLELEEVMLDFVSGKIDILVCTSIVESGLDIPSVNTLIVSRADTFGLSQLYQLKGRVGRSGTKAFAYFFYPANRPLSEIAQKRLQVIHEYSDLGSGFKVAMRDLEIRGAGNILGPQQSGDIIEVGFELYMKLLDIAVTELKGEEIEILARPTLSIKTNFYIPDSYIPDTKQKIEIYKKLEGATDPPEIQEVIKECHDRFGTPDTPMRILFSNELIRVLAMRLQLENIAEFDKGFRVRPGEKVRIEPIAIIELLKKDKYCRLSGKKQEILEILYTKKQVITEETKLERLKDVLQFLLNFASTAKKTGFSQKER